MSWMQRTKVQMGREIAVVIQDGGVVLLSEGILALVNGALENHNVCFFHINLQPWVPTAEFSEMTPPLPAWNPLREATYKRWAGGFVRRTQ